MNPARDTDFCVENLMAHMPKPTSDEEDFHARNQFDDARISRQLSDDKDVRRAVERPWTLNR